MRRKETQIKIKVRDYQIVVKVKVSPYLVLNANQSELLLAKYNHGFFKMENIKKNKMEFIGPIGISLFERLKKSISEYDFFFVVEQIIDITKKIEKVGLSRNNVVWDLNYIFINESTKELSFIYLPIITPHGGENINSFIEQIIYFVNPLENDTKYLSNFSYYLKRFNEFNVKEIEKYINEIHPEIISIIRGEGTKLNCYKECKGDKGQQNLDEDSAKSKEEDNDLTCMEQEDDEETNLLNDEETELLEEDDEETSLLNNEHEVRYRFPDLIRTATGECIKVHKPVFRIGKQENCVDYVIANNVAISRSHIDIITRGTKCFVFDLRSKNKSYINNRVIPTEQEVEIFNGDILKLADEEFLFRM